MSKQKMRNLITFFIAFIATKTSAQNVRISNIEPDAILEIISNNKT
jgi:hypothetical protein